MCTYVMPRCDSSINTFCALCRLHVCRWKVRTQNWPIIPMESSKNLECTSEMFLLVLSCTSDRWERLFPHRTSFVLPQDTNLQSGSSEGASRLFHEWQRQWVVMLSWIRPPGLCVCVSSEDVLTLTQADTGVQQTSLLFNDRKSDFLTHHRCGSMSGSLQR